MQTGSAKQNSSFLNPNMYTSWEAGCEQVLQSKIQVFQSQVLQGWVQTGSTRHNSSLLKPNMYRLYKAKYVKVLQGQAQACLEAGGAGCTGSRPI